MNKIRLIIFFAVAIITSFVSCNNDIQEPIYRISSIEEVTVEGENSTIDIQMTESDWVITGVYSINGQAITDGSKPLQLEGLGTLDSHWFKITREELSSLKIDIFENFEDNHRGMIIKIKKGSHTEEIKILQAISQGYKFKEIKYFLKEESTFNNNRGFPELIYNNYSDKESSVEMYPYRNTRETSYFKSESAGAFNWVSEEGVEVEVPILSNEKYFYNSATTSHSNKLNDVTFTVIAPPGKQLKVTGEFKLKKQVFNYTLTLINNRTKEEKEIKGEWIIEAPISYSETLELNELPEE